MSPRSQRTVLLFLLAALSATALLAAALPGLHLGPGLPLPAVEGGVVQLDARTLPSAGALPARTAVLWVLAAGGAVVLLDALRRGLRGVRLASALSLALRGLLLVAVVAAVAAALLFLGAPGGPILPEPAPPPAVPAPRSPLGAPPPLLLWLTAAGLLLLTALVAGRLLRKPAQARRALDLVGLEAERARAALLAGEDPRGVIVACYARMSAALAEERGIERPGSMTAREFGELLGSLGVPGPPVQELTRLFEAVRYGDARPGPGEEAAAVACLGPIVEHCERCRGAREA